MYLLLAKLGLYEASAHVAYGLDGDQAPAHVGSVYGGTLTSENAVKPKFAGFAF